jgi:hypothetical protein
MWEQKEKQKLKLLSNALIQMNVFHFIEIPSSFSAGDDSFVNGDIHRILRVGKKGFENGGRMKGLRNLVIG